MYLNISTYYIYTVLSSVSCGGELSASETGLCGGVGPACRANYAGGGWGQVCLARGARVSLKVSLGQSLSGFTAKALILL